MSSKEEKLKIVSNSILVTCGNLLTFLYTNTSYKAIPNPPAQIQGVINNEIKEFQEILDAIEIDVQNGIKYYTKRIETEEIKQQKLKKEESEKPKNKSPTQEAKSGIENNSSEIEGGPDLDDDDLFGDSTSLVSPVTGGDDVQKQTSPSHWTNEQVIEDNSQSQNNNNDNKQDITQDKGGFGDDDLKLEGLLDSAFGSMGDMVDNFDDFDRLIDDANAHKVDGQNPENKDMANDDLLDDGVGLFGPNFDFMMPSEE